MKVTKDCRRTPKQACNKEYLMMMATHDRNWHLSADAARIPSG